MFPNRSGDDDPEVITIIGRKEKAEAAKNHLEKLIKDLVSSLSWYVLIRMFVRLAREREREREREGGGRWDLVMVVRRTCLIRLWRPFPTFPLLLLIHAGQHCWRCDHRQPQVPSPLHPAKGAGTYSSRSHTKGLIQNYQLLVLQGLGGLTWFWYFDAILNIRYRNLCAPPPSKYVRVNHTCICAYAHVCI